MKRKTLTLVLCLLATFALASIGFASWVITNPGIETIGEQGNFEVYSTLEKNMKATVSFDNDTFIFGKPESYVPTSSDWLLAQGLEEEVLSSTMTITLDNADLLANGKIDVLIYLDNDNLEKAIENGYLTLSVNSQSATFVDETVNSKSVRAIKLTLTPELAGTTGTSTVSFVFGWGTKFGSVNPYTYYKGTEYSASKAAEAKTGLDAVENAVKGLNLKVYISKNS